MKRSLRIFALSVLALVILILSGCITITLNKKAPGAEPVSRGAKSYDISILYSSNVSAGSIQFEFLCADNECEITSISAGYLTDSAVFKYYVYEPVGAIIGIVRAEGIKGNGELAKVAVTMRGDPRLVRLSIENVVAYEADSMQPMLFETGKGSIDILQNTSVSLSLTGVTY